MGTPSKQSVSADSTLASFVTVRLGAMAAKAISASGQLRPERLERTLAQAVAYYLGPARGDAGWAFPKFLVADGEPAGRTTVRLEPAAWAGIVAEGERQGVEPDALLQHAALFFGAARDAGRLTDQIVAELTVPADPPPRRP